MVTRLVTPPAALAVSLAAARGALRIEGSDLDSVITGWVGGITEKVEHELGRALIHQGWRLTLDAFPVVIDLPGAPLVRVDSVKYIDSDGVQQTLGAAEYLVDAAAEPGCIVPAPGKCWPATGRRLGAVVVDYTCGYGADDAAVPKAIQLYILAKLAEQFDPAPRTDQQNVQSAFIASLMDRYKVYA